MLDFHAHILPGADHGSDGLTTSLKQLALAEEAGIDTIIATSHFYPQVDELNQFLRLRQHALEALLAHYQGPIRVIPGAEVHMCVGLDHLEGLEQLCARGTSVMLCELPFRNYPGGLTETFQRLLDRGITPVLAHVDRYDPIRIENLFSMGLLGQLNAEPLTHRLHRRRFLPWIDQGSVTALGSDIHGTQVGYTQYRKAADFLGPRFQELEERARALLKDAR